MTNQVTLNKRLDTSEAEALRDALKGGLGSDMTLDAAETEHVGGLCLELLLTARTLQEREGHAFEVINISDDLTKHLNLMGVAPADLNTEAAA